MMVGYGAGLAWMTLMPLLWIALIALIVWAGIQFVRRSADEGGWPGGETPQEILDRRFASGQIDAEAYRQARAYLAGQEPGSS